MMVESHILVHRGGLHLVEHHQIGGQRQVLVVQEGGHVRIGGDHPLFAPCPGRVVVPRNAHDAVDFSLGHQRLRFAHAGAVVGDRTLARGIQLLDIAPAVAPLAQVHHSYRHLVDYTMPVDAVVQQRIHQSGEQEDQHYAAVVQHEVQFIGENVPDILEPLSDIRFCSHD